jgi:CheY-like chemotaxis protein
VTEGVRPGRRWGSLKFEGVAEAAGPAYAGVAFPRAGPHHEDTNVARVLIVDDEESDRLMAQAILAHAGHETFFAHDGEEALRQYALQDIDVIVTDLHMPQVHGFELISVLRDFPRAPALVVMSGTGQFQLQMAEALGARYTLCKPLDASLLVDAVDRALADTGRAPTAE